MQKYILKSGKVIELNLAPMETALNLYKAVIRECKGQGLDLTIADETTILDLLNKNIDAILSIMSSDDVIEAAKECSLHVLYDKVKFSLDIFEEPKNRADFIPFITLVCIENLRYFFAEAHIVFDIILSRLVK